MQPLPIGFCGRAQDGVRNLTLRSWDEGGRDTGGWMEEEQRKGEKESESTVKNTGRDRGGACTYMYMTVQPQRCTTRGKFRCNRMQLRSSCILAAANQEEFTHQRSMRGSGHRFASNIAYSQCTPRAIICRKRGLRCSIFRRENWGGSFAFSGSCGGVCEPRIDSKDSAMGGIKRWKWWVYMFREEC